MIKIFTAWTHPGGSTTALINLNNAFINKGYESCLYGPHDWHMDKTNAKKIGEASVTADDHIISHFCSLGTKIKPKAHILSLHEKELFTLDKVNVNDYDWIHFVSENQMKWHGSPEKGFVCPNIVDRLELTPLPKERVAGIIGSIDKNKRTHISIKRALGLGITDIRIFGFVTDKNYFEGVVLPLIRKHHKANIKLMGHVDDKQKIYDQCSDIILSSISETWSYIKVETEMTGRMFHGTNAIEGNHSMNLTEDQIVDMWKEKLGL